MAESSSNGQSPARRRAEDLFNKRERLDTEHRLFQQDRWDAETAKIARLKSLRLARDADNQSAKSPAKEKATSKKKGDGKIAGGSR
ncbi:MAG: hypothetical protein ACKVOI_20535 [Dongiaceae bacterium]